MKFLKLFIFTILILFLLTRIPLLFVEIPKEKELISNLYQVNKSTITMPKGSNFTLKLVIKKDYLFNGKITISNQNEKLYSLEFNHKSINETKLIKQVNSDIYDVYDLASNIDIKNFLLENRKYNILLEFDTKPIEASLWLFWLHSYF